MWVRNKIVSKHLRTLETPSFLEILNTKSNTKTFAKSLKYSSFLQDSSQKKKNGRWYILSTQSDAFEYEID